MHASDVTPEVARQANDLYWTGDRSVNQITEDLDLFLDLDQLTIDEGESQRVFTVLRSRSVKNYWLIHFDEIQDLDAAKALKGSGVYVEDDCLRPLDEDEFFIHDLVGTKVFSTEDQYLGIVTGFFEAGNQGVFEVKDEEGLFLFPASREVLKEIDPGKKVIINLIPGLVDLNR